MIDGRHVRLGRMGIEALRTRTDYEITEAVEIEESEDEGLHFLLDIESFGT